MLRKDITLGMLFVFIILVSPLRTLSGSIPSIESTITDSRLMDSAWPMKCHDTRHTGRSPYSTANNPGTEKWRFETDGWLDGGISIDSDGILYFGGEYGVYPWYLHAVYPNGTLKWRYKTDGLIWSTPAISDDGTIYIGSFDDFLYAINPNGTLKWKLCVHDSIASSPAIADDGTIYFGTMGTGYNIYAVNPNGTEKWHYKTGYRIYSGPAIGDDGTIYIGSGDTYLYAMFPNGTLKWRFKTGDWVRASPSIADDGTIYFGSYDDYLYALYPNGTMKWRFNTVWGTDVNPSIASDGTIYVGTNDLYAIYPNGTLKWVFNIGDRDFYQSCPAISADGTIYFGVEIGDMGGGEIIAVNPDGTERWRKRIAEKWVASSPAIGEDGTVYIGSSSSHTGSLHAFGAIEDNIPPTIEITKPIKAIYISNNEFLPSPIPFIIGEIDIETQTSDDNGVDKVEFYIDGILKKTDRTTPHSLTWDTPAFFIHRIKVVAYDFGGNTAEDSTLVWKIF